MDGKFIEGTYHFPHMSYPTQVAVYPDPVFPRSWLYCDWDGDYPKGRPRSAAGKLTKDVWARLGAGAPCRNCGDIPGEGTCRQCKQVLCTEFLFKQPDGTFVCEVCDDLIRAAKIELGYIEEDDDDE